MTDFKKRLNRIVRASWFIPSLLSLVFHLLFFGMKPEFSYDSMFKKYEDENREEVIKIVLIDDKDSDKKQIVNTEQTGKKEPPKDTRFLGKTNQKFDRETVAKKVDSFKAASKGEIKGQKIVNKNKNRKKQQKKQIVSLKDLSLHKSFEALANNKQKQPAKVAVGIRGGSGKRPSRGQSNDYIDDLPLGDMTRVNTKEYRYFGFYDRIRKKLEQFWGSTLRKKARKLYKSGRRFPASIDRITSLKVTIDKKGNIIDIAIKGTSGVAELDEAAVESFNKAGPFPNPPSELVKNGHADIEWGFVVKS